jgi:hypothetical protein
MALGSIQPLTDLNIINLRVKGSLRVGWLTIFVPILWRSMRSFDVSIFRGPPRPVTRTILTVLSHYIIFCISLLLSLCWN